ncbi:hypothetical protein [Methyloceanibacter sp.]|uniref:hypothetical protein n=1 Tax=Methyloceanibacter sp. TaxID=1965321 RepID=UPI002D5FC60F|nr:hypothetical protein [Methyloceanibacter sp.]HZP08675.1 hypothetical protein [Methyloceanibacter sp.]
MEQDDARGDGDGIDWDAIERAVVHGDWSLRRIAVAHGVGETTIRTRMLKQGWVRLTGTKPLLSGFRAGKPGVPKEKRAKPKRFNRRKMVQRLFRLLDAKLREIEERMANTAGEGASPTSAADTERDVRAFGQLMRIYAKLAEIDDAERKAKGDKQDNADLRTIEDADSLRREIARRLERLMGAGEE